MHEADDSARPVSVHYRGLDGLRAIAVGFVVWHNWGALPFTARFGNAGELRAGYVGVTLFFVLSGFLITDILLRDIESGRGLRYRAFYARRAFRLFPALGVCFAMLLGIAALRHHPWPDTFLALGSAAVYVYNLVALRSSPLHPLGTEGWGHLWSLAVEEQFYLVWPVLLGVASRRLRPRRLVQMGGLAVVVVAARRTVLWLQGASFSRLYLATDTRIDAVLLGAVLAFGIRMQGDQAELAKRLRWLLAPSLAGLLVLAYFGSGASTVDRPGWLIGPGMILPAILAAFCVFAAVCGVDGKVIRVLDSAPLAAIGRRSYGIYLFHVPVLAFVEHWQGGWFYACLLTALTTELVYRVVERPIRTMVPAWTR